MSESTVCRTADTYQALRYCLLLDGDRIAGGKPDYRGDNILISWNTKETYDAVDELMKENAKLRDENQSIGMAAYELGRSSIADENAKLRELVRDWRALAIYGADSLSDWIEIQDDLESRMRELGVEV